MERSGIFMTNIRADAWMKTNHLINQAFNKKLKKQVKYLLIILVLVICTPIYVRQYENTYTDPKERKELSASGIFLD